MHPVGFAPTFRAYRARVLLLDEGCMERPAGSAPAISSLATRRLTGSTMAANRSVAARAGVEPAARCFKDSSPYRYRVPGRMKLGAGEWNRTTKVLRLRIYSPLSPPPARRRHDCCGSTRSPHFNSSPLPHGTRTSEVLALSDEPLRAKRARRGVEVDVTGVEPATSWLQTRRSPD